MDFEYLEHTADVKFRAYGETWEEVFQNASKAMFEVMVDTNSLKSDMDIELDANASTLDELVVSWLNELLFQSETEQIIFKEAIIEKIWQEGGKWHVKGKAIGEKLNSEMKFKTEIKAVTYYQLEIGEADERKFCQITVDI